MSYSLVWFKRDLRWQDHAALAAAAQHGAVRCIYVVEPEIWAQPDAALQHFEFVRESLQALDQQASGALQLVQALPPVNPAHLGQSIDVFA